MKEIVHVFFFIPLTLGGYLFYDSECPTNISKLEQSFYTGFRLTTIFSNSLTVDEDFELVSLTYNRSNPEEIIRIDGSARFPRNELWTKKYIPIKSWPLYLHHNCFKFYNDGDECLPKMDTLIIYLTNSNEVKEPFKFVNYQFEQFFPCEPGKIILFSHEEIISFQNKSAVFIPRKKQAYYFKNFNFDEFALDNLHDYDESRKKYIKVLRNIEEFEEFSIKSDINFKYDFEDPLGPFRKVHDIVYENGNIVEI